MPSLIDAYLVFRIRSEGDRNAFTRLYDRHIKSIYRFVYAKLSSKEAVEDVVSEVFLELWRILSQGTETIQSVRGLLFQIARRRVIDVYRHKTRRPTERFHERVVTDEGGATTSIYEGELSDQGVGHRATEHKAELALLLRHIRRLKEDYQDVLLLRLVEGLSFPEIALAINKSHANVRVIYHRGLTLLKRFIDE